MSVADEEGYLGRGHGVPGRSTVDHLRALAVFASVVHHGSFRGAARELDLAPSVVSHHVSSLERRLRVVLLYRSTRKLSLTPEGKRLFEVTSAMLSSADAALASLAQEGEDPSGTLRVSAPAAAGAGPLMGHFSEFLQLYPRVRMEMTLTEQPRSLADGDFDLIVSVAWNQVPKNGRLLYSVPGVLVASRRYIEDRPVPVRPADIADWDWLHFTPRPKLERFAHSSGEVETLEVRDRLSVDSVNALQRLAIEGLGVCRIPRFMANPTLATGAIVEILPEWTLHPSGIYAIYPPQLADDGILAKLVSFLVLRTAEMPLTS